MRIESMKAVDILYGNPAGFIGGIAKLQRRVERILARHPRRRPQPRLVKNRKPVKMSA